MQTSNLDWNGGRHNVPSSDSHAQVDIERASILEVYYPLTNGNFKEDQKSHLGSEHEDGSCITQQPAEDIQMASDTNPVSALFDGTWRSPVSSHFSSFSDEVDERTSSSESVDSEMCFSLDDALSLDDVLEEMDPFESTLSMNVPITTHLTNDLSNSYTPNSLYQLPIANISSSDPCNLSQEFNIDFVKCLQNPSRGLITAVRRLCELLSIPKSDHLDYTFVRILNNALKEMEEASQPRFKPRTRGSGTRQVDPNTTRKWPKRCVSDDTERSLELASIALGRSSTSKAQSVSPVSSKPRSFTETIDLTGLEDCVKDNIRHHQGNHMSEEKSFIVLEDTVPNFMRSFLSS